MASTISTKTFRTLTLLTLAVVVAAIGAVVAAAAKQALIGEHAWLMMITLALLVGPISTVRIPGANATVALGDVVTFSCTVLFGPSAGVLAAVVDGTVTSLGITKSPRKFVYNVASCAISMAGSSLIARVIFPEFGTRGPSVSLGRLSIALGIFTISYFVISTSLIAAYIAFSNGESVIRVWRQKFLWTFMSYLASGISALVTFALVDRLGYLVFAIVIAVMVAMFLFYRVYFGKVKVKSFA